MIGATIDFNCPERLNAITFELARELPRVIDAAAADPEVHVMADDARIGYPPTRVWGIPTAMMWVYRLGIEQAKRMLFTGDLVSGKEAEAMGLIQQSVPADELDSAVQALCDRIKGVPRNQLVMSKMVVNQAYEAMGMANTPRFATLFDGFARHSPEGKWFEERDRDVGYKQAVAERDSGDPIAEGRRKDFSPCGIR